MKNAFVQMIVELEKSGVRVFLTPMGVEEVLKNLKGDIEEYVRGDAEAV